MPSTAFNYEIVEKVAVLSQSGDTTKAVSYTHLDLLSSSMMIEYYHDTLPGVKLIRPASFSGSMGRKG